MKMLINIYLIYPKYLQKILINLLLHYIYFLFLILFIAYSNTIIKEYILKRLNSKANLVTFAGYMQKIKIVAFFNLLEERTLKNKKGRFAILKRVKFLL